MDRPSRHSGEERAIRDTIGVEVGETCNGLIEDGMQLTILYMAIDSIYVLLCRAMIRHLGDRFETERLGSGVTGHVEFLDDRLILASAQKRVINKCLSTTPSHIRLRMIRIDKNTYNYRQLRQH